MGTLYYFLKEAVRGFYQAKLMTFVSIVSIAASLFFMGIVVLGLINLQSILEKTKDQPEIAVYITDSVKEGSADMDQLIEQIRQMPEVRLAVLITKDSAWERFLRMHGSEMLESVDENPLPATLEVYLSEQYRSSEDAQNLQQKMQQINGVENVRYSREWIDLIERFRWYFFTASVIAGLILSLVLHFMISNTIKLTIYARKELVQNMHLVGATDTFINMPFLLEGMLQGLIGGLICIAAITFLRMSMIQVPLLWGPETFPLIILSIGVFFGWIGSLSAVRKFLA
ncbi:MAG: ABC transporter permease [Fibrobacter sp.]|nr:ABC transporter permease [Fibrobacter sp.]